jgi:hypothetical protein
MAIYRVLYINEVGADILDPGEQDEEDFVRQLAEEIGDDLEEVQAFIIGVPENLDALRHRPWYTALLRIEPINTDPLT